MALALRPAVVRLAGRLAPLATSRRPVSSAFVVPPPPTPALAVEGGRFPVRRIYCVGRNYWEHAVEMGGAPEREPPFVFHKPPDAVVDTSAGAALPFPVRTEYLAYEAELVFAIGREGQEVPEREAASYIFAYGVGVDLTRRDMQDEAKKLRRPWCTSKGFDLSAPVGALVPAERVSLAGRTITMTVNGERRQQSELSKMIWSPEEIVLYISSCYRLMPGDLVFTGTPAGVGRLSPGDLVEAAVEGLPPCSFRIG